MINFSSHKKRNHAYQTFLASCQTQSKSVNDIIQLGYRLMRRAGLHPHFFQNNSLLATAHYLTFFSLQRQVAPETKLSTTEAEKILLLFEKRISERIPVEYITHEARYLDYTFYVNKNVLVPRSLMNNRFTDFLSEMHWENYRVLDLCTGSGCVGISLALLHPEIKVDLADIDSQALDVAKINIERHHLQDRVQAIQSNVFSNIKERYDLIISNPPYVSTADYNATPTEFKNEPKIALESGRDGLDIINQILRQAKHHLNPNGCLIMEVGYPAAKLLKKRYRQIPFEWFTYKKPIESKSKFGKWLDAILAMDGFFRVSANAL